MKWNAEAHVTLDPMRPVRGRYGSDSWRWHWLTLSLLTNRHVGEHVEDSEVSRHLAKVWKEQRHLIPFDVE
jgi:hypothetical protein